MSYGQQKQPHGHQQTYSFDSGNAQQYAYMNAFNQYSQQALAPGYSGASTAGASGMSSSNSVPLGSGKMTAVAASTDAHYKSYEQAVIEHAKLLQVQQAKEKLFGVPAPKKATPYAGYNGAGMFTKKKKIPKEPIDPRKYFCDVCNVACGSEQSLETHKTGKSHKHKESLKTGKSKLDITRPGYHCEVCNATCSTKEAFAAHIAGQKHNRVIKTLQMLGKPVPEYLLAAMPKGDPMQHLPVQKKVVGVSSTKFVGGLKLSTTGDDYTALLDSNNDDSFPAIGEEFLEVVSTAGKKTTFRCKLCECNCGDPASRDLHVRGRRHRLSYKEKIDSSIDVEEKMLPRAMMPPPRRRKQPPRPLFPSYEPASALPNTKNYDAYDEQFVQARLEMLRPTAERMEKIEELVELVERSLKKVSDALVETTNDEEQDTRLLSGVIRVGPLGENLILNFDKHVDVVLLCKSVPSIRLLSRIVAEIPKTIDDDEVRERLVVETHAEDSGFSVNFKDFDFKCVVSLTSVTLRNLNENGDKSESNASAAVKPADALPEAPCLRALAAHRHTKFFQAQSNTIRNLSGVVQLLRDVCHRIDTWGALSLYVLELLAFKALASNATPLRISDGLRRFFEMIAGGVFMGARSELIDPCEKEKVNALKHLTPQQRENLVCSAQHGLRLITYDQIYTILGMSKDSANRKRAGGDNDENEAKKPHLVGNQSKSQ